MQEDENFIHIFLHLCTGGDLFTYISSHPSMANCLCEAEAKYIMFQLLKGLRYLHDNMISHRDLKPENILLYFPGPYPRIQIADFGLARPNAYQETFNVCGTVSYLPPEAVLALDCKHLGYVGMPADCWSAGVILFIMLSGTHPFDIEKPETLSNWISRVQQSRVSGNLDVSQTYQQTETRLKSRIIDGRIDFQSHPWDRLSDAKYLIEGLLTNNFQLRATVRSALRSRWFTCELDQLEHLYEERITHELDMA